MSSYLAKQQAFKEDPKAFSEGQYLGASVMPGTGEAIAAYELPGILSQAKEMIQGDDTLRAFGGLGLATLGTASVLPFVGPGARALTKTLQGIEKFAPYMGPRLATEGADTSRLAMSDQSDLFTGSSPSAKTTDNLNLGSGSLFSAESKKGRKLLIVSCSDTKCPDDGDMKAMDRYLGPIFQTLKAQGVPPNVDVAIMSAKHGLIKADTPLENYNLKMSKDLADKFKGDPDQMNRIRNTMAGYDDVIVQGGKDYKDVLRTAAGDMNIKEIPGGRGIGDQRNLMMNAIAPFRKINTPVYHFTLKPGFTKFDKSKQAFYDFGPHVSSTSKGAQDRFVSQVGGVTTKDGELIFKTDSDLKGGSIPLKADLSKPFNNPKTGKPFTEEELNIFKASEIDKILKKEGFKDTFTTEDLFLNTLDGSSGQKDFFRAIDNTSDIRELINKVSQNLAKDGFTHVPYVNAFEDKGQLSFEMLVDRPKGSTKVLQSPFAKKDPAAADDADFMKADGGVVEMKDGGITDSIDRALFDPDLIYKDAKEKWNEGNYTDAIGKIAIGIYADTPLLKNALSNVNEAVKKTRNKYGDNPSFNTTLDVFKNLMLNEEGNLKMMGEGKIVGETVRGVSENLRKIPFSPTIMLLDSFQNKAEGGVVEMKDKAVNMYRGKQGIEPFIKYMV